MAAACDGPRRTPCRGQTIVQPFRKCEGECQDVDLRAEDEEAAKKSLGGKRGRETKRKMSKILHPDKNNSTEEADKAFKRAEAAYAALERDNMALSKAVNKALATLCHCAKHKEGDPTKCMHEGTEAGTEAECKGITDWSACKLHVVKTGFFGRNEHRPCRVCSENDLLSGSC